MGPERLSEASGGRELYLEVQFSSGESCLNVSGKRTLIRGFSPERRQRRLHSKDRLPHAASVLSCHVVGQE